MTATADSKDTWTAICKLSDIVPDTGVGALVAGNQVAVFRLLPDDQLFAIAAHDPFSGANVLARGIVGDRSGVPIVASPIYKQAFDLRTGQCLDDDAVSVDIYPVRVSDGVVEVGTIG